MERKGRRGVGVIMEGCVDGQGVVQMDAGGGCWGKKSDSIKSMSLSLQQPAFSLLLSRPCKIVFPLPVILLFTVIILCTLTHLWFFL